LCNAHQDTPRPQTLPLDEADMLELRPNCECCDVDLPATTDRAFICSFECTFCADCAADVLNGRCPNCNGNLTPRPSRASHFLARSPASPLRVLKAGGCAAKAG
jgi:hypothetical protein